MEETINIITLGQSSVGKTSIINRIVDNDNFEDNYEPTIGFDCLSITKEYNNKSFKSIKYIYWDTAGTENYNSITKRYIQDKDIILLIYCDLNSLEALKERWYELVKELIDVKNSIFLVIANKSDTFGDNYDQIKKKGKEFALEINSYLQFCSAKSRENIDNIIEHIEHEAIRLIEERQKASIKNNEKKKGKNPKKKTSGQKVIIKNNKKNIQKKSECC